MKQMIAAALLALATLHSPTNAQAGVRENGGRIAPMAIRLVFWSPGNGINRELYEAVSALIASYKEAGLVEAHTEKSWGREGEVTVCVQASQIDAAYRLRQEISELILRKPGKTNTEILASCSEEDGE